MAFTNAERARLRELLGVPAAYRDQYLDVEGRFERVEQDRDAEDRVRVHLTDVATIETQLGKSWKRLAVDGVDDVRLAGWREVNGLRREGRRLVRIICTIFDLTAYGFPLSDHFGEGGGRGNAMKIG